MKYLSKLFLLVVISLLFIGYSFAGRGCCSHHGGQSYCDDGRRVCNDGSYSPTCTCDGGSYDNSYNTYNSYNTNSYRVTYCPAHSQKTSNGECECVLGYKSNSLSNGCEVDQDYQCNKKYPGTVRDYNTKKCICPKGNPMGRDKIQKGCPVSDEECAEQYGYGSIGSGYATCVCKDGFIFDENKKCVSTYNYVNSITDKKEDSSNFGGWIILAIIGGVIYLVRRKKK